jgi:hypothetical protein
MHYSPVTITPEEANISGNNDCGEAFFVLALINYTNEGWWGRGEGGGVLER